MKKTKIIWIDTETTGLNENKHSLIQIACLIEIDGQIIDKLDLKIRPFKGALISKESMEKNNITIEKLKSKEYLPYPKAFEKFIKFLEPHCNRYDREDKMVIAGKNVKFDIRFLREFFIKNDDSYFGSWFLYPSINIENYIAELCAFDGLRLINYKLETLCKFFDIKLDNAHDALCDIESTRNLYWRLKGILSS